MPKTKQQLFRRRIAHAYCDIDRAMEHLLGLKNEFEDAHPELAQALEVALQGCLAVERVIQQFCMAAWGRVPDDFHQWRNAKRLTRSMAQEARGVEPTA